ncbi:hypothetical protein P4418_15205 [Bacillus thuringiensis]|uniref:hypothetical protein n=2 Tax=Bacillus thuringiensis TaxID=1428 RepID=UPI0018CC8BE2|nr:hypothetical protein [Bacillus thuringiensis]EKS8373793.1 hypothetical protein [Bacillus cereus]MBG9506980.1 hypothetical protein [Bacillus thuringiensis]MBG9508324.1 hypothetical protein [Bacillus thuringiensis]MED3390171.1 hypothetical protein [Bacillus thuringiensis]
MIFKLSLALLLLLLAGIWLFIGHYLKTSLLLGLGLGVMFGVIIMLLPDVLEWMIKEDRPETMFLLSNKEASTSLFLFTSHIQMLHLQ